MTGALTQPSDPSTTRGGRLPVVTGVLAQLGGAAWTAAALLHASQPTGCVGDGCGTAPMREATAATTWLVGAAALLLAASGLGLLLVVHRAGRLRRPAIAGASVCALAMLTLGVAVVLQAFVYGGDWAGMPYLVGPGVFLLAVGAILVGWDVHRSGVLPRWAGVALIVGALLLVASNEQTAAVLLAVPFGVAWAATGLMLVVRRPPNLGSKPDL